MSINTSMADCALEPFTLDWTAFFEVHGLTPGVDLITSSTWVVTNGTKGNEFVDTPETTVELSGGVVGVPILAENIIEVNGGALRDCRTLRVEIF